MGRWAEERWSGPRIPLPQHAEHIVHLPVRHARAAAGAGTDSRHEDLRRELRGADLGAREERKQQVPYLVPTDMLFSLSHRAGAMSQGHRLYDVQMLFHSNSALCAVAAN